MNCPILAIRRCCSAALNNRAPAPICVAMGPKESTLNLLPERKPTPPSPTAPDTNPTASDTTQHNPKPRQPPLKHGPSLFTVRCLRFRLAWPFAVYAVHVFSSPGPNDPCARPREMSVCCLCRLCCLCLLFIDYVCAPTRRAAWGGATAAAPRRPAAGACARPKFPSSGSSAARRQASRPSATRWPSCCGGA